jgi:hypothetical protein
MPQSSTLGLLGLFSRKLDATQVKNTNFDRELVACLSGFRPFRHIWRVVSSQYILITNPLTYALSRTSDAWSARQARQLSYLVEHTADIQHIAG